jgi:hypothetical protein
MGLFTIPVIGRSTVPSILATATCVFLAGCGGVSSGLASRTTTTGDGTTTSAASSGSSTTAAVSTNPRPKILVVVTSAGALLRLDPTTGAQMRTLVPAGVVGDEVAVSPDRSSVYFEVNKGCDHQIQQVGINGGDISVVASGGSLPAINAAGDVLACAQEPLAYSAGCAPSGADNGAGQWKLVVDNLSTNVVKALPMTPDAVSSGLPFSISHLSWSADGSRLAVSIAAPEDNEGWALNLVDPTSASYYFGDSTPTVPLPAGQTSSGWYWREGVFQPDGNLFVVKQCCAGLPQKRTSVELDQVNPTSDTTLRTVAIGLTDVDHTSLSVDTTGTWLLYLSGNNLEVSHDGARPVQLASGFVAAAW